MTRATRSATRWPTCWGLLVLACVPALAFALDEPKVPYTVRIDGVADKELAHALADVSDALALEKRLPATLVLLKRRVDRDVPRLIQVLRAQGYYDGTVTTAVDESVAPVAVTFQVSPGAQYLLTPVTIEVLDAAPGTVALPYGPALGLVPGKPALSKDILAAQRNLADALHQRGYPFAGVTERRVEVDRAAPDHGVFVTFRVTLGARAAFGALDFTGLSSVDETFLRDKTPWKEGDLYDGSLLSKYQGRLVNTGLFTTAQVTAGDALDDAGRLPVHVAVTERKPRTIGAGIGYKTDEGLGTRAWWAHRNLFGHGERLELGATLSGIEGSFDGQYKKPAFLRPDQSLTLKLRVAHDRPDAFESSGLESEATIERAVSERLSLGGGVAFRESNVKQLRRSHGFTLLSFPLHGNWDGTDETFDPTRGGKLALKFAPYFDLEKADFGFLKTTAGYSHYLSLDASGKLILAGRAQAGALLGAGHPAIPANERFYAGGGGSIRGYPYQSVAPLRQGDPIGGRSLVELGAELRYKWTDRLGFVAFLDGGTATLSQTPDFAQPLRWGAGLGARYYTPVGPLRFDIGIPLNPPANVSDRYQIYLSLGNAF